MKKFCGASLLKLPHPTCSSDIIDKIVEEFIAKLDQVIKGRQSTTRKIHLFVMRLSFVIRRYTKCMSVNLDNLVTETSMYLINMGKF